MYFGFDGTNNWKVLNDFLVTSRGQEELLLKIMLYLFTRNTGDRLVLKCHKGVFLFRREHDSEP